MIYDLVDRVVSALSTTTASEANDREQAQCAWSWDLSDNDRLVDFVVVSPTSHNNLLAPWDVNGDELHPTVVKFRATTETEADVAVAGAGELSFTGDVVVHDQVALVTAGAERIHVEHRGERADAVTRSEVAGEKFVRNRNKDARAFVSCGDVGIVGRSSDLDAEFVVEPSDVNRDRASIGVFFNLTAVDNTGASGAAECKYRRGNASHF